MRKKRIVLVAAGLSLLFSGCFVYANGGGFSWKEFYNLSGEPVYYPIVKSAVPEICNGGLLQENKENVAPELAEIGDVFESKDGYERVIAVSKDGAYVTEIVPSLEDNE